MYPTFVFWNLLVHFNGNQTMNQTLSLVHDSIWDAKQLFIYSISVCLRICILHDTSFWQFLMGCLWWRCNSLRLIGFAMSSVSFNLVTRVRLLQFLEHWKVEVFNCPTKTQYVQNPIFLKILKTSKFVHTALLLWGAIKSMILVSWKLFQLRKLLQFASTLY